MEKVATWLSCDALTVLDLLYVHKERTQRLHIQALFTKTVGEVHETFIVYNSQGNSKGMAVVRFAREGDAYLARNKYNGKIIDGRTYVRARTCHFRGQMCVSHLLTCHFTLHSAHKCIGKPIKIEIIKDEDQPTAAPAPAAKAAPPSLLERLGGFKGANGQVAVAPMYVAPLSLTPSLVSHECSQANKKAGRRCCCEGCSSDTRSPSSPASSAWQGCEVATEERAEASEEDCCPLDCGTIGRGHRSIQDEVGRCPYELTLDIMPTNATLYYIFRVMLYILETLSKRCCP